jgi:hypothetical protein
MTYEVRRNFRTTQAEEHTLIWAAHQLEKWTQRWAIERDRTPADPDPVLADVRNAMEHLYEADFDEHAVAVPGPFGSNRSLRKLPYGSVPRGVGNRLAGRLAVMILRSAHWRWSTRSRPRFLTRKRAISSSP